MADTAAACHRSFSRQGAGVTRNFDLCVAPKSVAGETAKPYVFSGIDRSEYTSLYSFLSTKKLRIKNIKQSGNDKAMLQLGDLDDHDPYKAALDDDQVAVRVFVPDLFHWCWT